MPVLTTDSVQRRISVFALANAGGVIGYLPLLSLLLPIRIAEVAPDTRIGLLTITAIVGAGVASASNILFGWWSDRSLAHGGGRRRFVVCGLLATIVAYGVLAVVRSPVAIVLAIAAFQLTINAMLGPFLAMMADEVPDDRKGAAGGLLALASPMASAVSAVVVGSVLLAEEWRFAIVAAAMTACTLPLLLGRPLPPILQPAVTRTAPTRLNMGAALLARLLVQIAGSVLFCFLLYYFQSVAPDVPARAHASSVGRLMTVAYILPLPLAVVFGRLSDRTGRRKPFLIGSAVLAASGLVVMAVATGWRGAAVAFTLYAVGSSTFLALHATFAMQLLPSARHRGRDLGLLNLTNTLPSLIGPVLAWTLATPKDFGALMLTLALLTALGGAAMIGVREPKAA